MKENTPTPTVFAATGTVLPAARRSIAGASGQVGELVIEGGSHHQLSPALRWVFYLFVFSIPFESLLTSLADGAESNLTLPKIAGYILMVVAIVQPRICFRKPPVPFWCFAAYGYTALVIGALQDVESHRLAFEQVFTLGQMLILFWVGFHLMRYDRVAEDALLALALSCSLLSMLQVLGITTTMIGNGLLPGYSEGPRISALGQDANTTGAVLALGLLSFIGIAYGRARSPRYARLLAWPFMAVIGVTIVWTGSRGATLALAAGLLVFLTQGGARRSKASQILVTLAAMVTLVWASFESEALRSRWDYTFGTGSLALREKILPTAWDMFLEKPVFGWGAGHYYYELGSRLSEPLKDVHNLYLAVLVETGIVGAIPFYAGLWFCLRAAWKARPGVEGVLPLAMLLTVMAANMSLTWHYRKLHWLVLAYALASGSRMVLKPGRPAARRSPPRAELSTATKSSGLGSLYADSMRR